MTNGWHVGKFDDVLEPVSRPVQVEADKVYRNLGVQWYAHGLFIRAEKPGHEIRAKELYRVELGDLVYNRLFAWKGSFAIANKDTAGGFVSGEFPCFRVDTKRADAKYLHLYLSQEKIWKEIERTSTGQTSISRLRLKEPVFLGMDIPLPPLDEQRRIVKYVESLASHIAKALSIREEADAGTEALWQSTLHRIFDEYKSDIKVLNEYSTFISDGTHVTPNYVDSGIPFITVRNIANRKLSFANLKYITQEQHEIYCKRVKAEYGDVLYTKDGTLGVPCFIDSKKDFSFFVSVAIIKPKRDLLDGRYLTYILDAPQVHEQVMNTKTGAVLQHIVIRAIKAINIPIPPLDEQRRIVAYLDSVQGRLASLRELQSATGEELSALLPSVLDKAFKGEL